MLVRGALCRLAGDLPKTSTHDLSHLARAFQNSFARRNALSVPVIHAISRAYRRTYVTKAEATTPTPTVKKAVKKVAAAKKPAAKKTTAKKTTAAKKKKTTASKKAAPKKKAKKTAAKKPAAKKKVKKVLTPEEKEKKLIRELKAQAFLDFSLTTRTILAKNVHDSEFHKGKKGSNDSMHEAAERYKNLTPAEKEHYNHLAHQQTEAKRAEYRKWVHSHTPEEIRLANNARAALKKKLAGKQKRLIRFAKIEDDRAPKRTRNPYMFFVAERNRSGDFKNVKFADVGVLIAKEWAALSASEKKPYEDESAEDKARYAREYEQTYDVKHQTASS